MTGVRDDFLAAARAAAHLLRDPAVAAAWRKPSALAEFSVAGLAGHLAFQVLAMPRILVAPEPEEPTVSILDHYGRALWIGAAVDAEINVSIRAGGEEAAAGGPDALATQVDQTIADLADSLPAEPNRPVRLPLWGPWSLLLDDLVITRLMELTVHSDDGDPPVRGAR